MFAVTATTGQLGRKVIEHLKQLVDPDQIVAIVRDPSKGYDLGVQVRRASYEDSAAMKKALAGVERLLLISGTPDQPRVPLHQNVVEAAKANSVQHLVYTSVLHANRWVSPIMQEHAQTERIIGRSGVGFTILRNGWYTENNISGLDGVIENGKIPGAAGAGRIAWAARGDYAEAAAKILAAGEAAGHTYELGGDQALSMSELAEEISVQSGRPVSYANLPREAYVATLVSLGLPAPIAEGFAALEADDIARDILATNSKDLSNILGRFTTPLSETVRAALGVRLDRNEN
jgi:NAD(P)H dehydrogenase (quinone)